MAHAASVHRPHRPLLSDNVSRPLDPRCSSTVDDILYYLGGMTVIIAVLGIFVFILFQILPLFQGAKVQELYTCTVARKDLRGFRDR